MRALLLLAAMAMACESTLPPPSHSPVGSATPTPRGLTFVVDAPRARFVATLVGFLDAYNAQRFEEALAIFTDEAGVSDCDYRAVRVITAYGRAEIADWLQARFAEHDRLELGEIFNENPGPGGGSVVGARFLRRRSDTLAALGFADGIDPDSAAKVVFDPSGRGIRAFANGPVGGPAEVCRPR